ncbi:hypothetical protein MJO28_017123, partial [Puccinia striiformis f. sp. tritici]
ASKPTTHRRAGELFNFYPDSIVSPPEDELAKFPILASMAKDYLACSATSASVERCFSAAADVCGRDRGNLAVRTIERCVSAQQWLRQGIQANGDFDMAQAVITQAMEEHKEAKAKKAKATI